jgi:hypothetical protein
MVLTATPAAYAIDLIDTGSAGHAGFAFGNASGGNVSS